MPRQGRAWRTRARILASAARVFGEHGYAAGTTDRIAEDANLSIGSLYQYFPNKDAILLVLALDHLDDAAAAIDRALACPTDRPPRLDEWLPALVSAVVRSNARDPRLQRVVFDEAPRPPELIARFKDAEDRAVRATTDLLERDPELEIGDAARVARFTIAAVESLTHRFIGLSPPIDEEELSGEITRMAHAYIRAS